MNRQAAESLYAACERVLSELATLEKCIGQVEEHEERSRFLKALGITVSEVLSSLRAPVLQQFPELEPPEELGEPDTVLDEEGQVAASRLTAAEVEAIDEALIAECASSWRKVARVVGSAMRTHSGMSEGLPDSYYAQRVVALVAGGRLESQGNVHYMRFSEVRLPQERQGAA